MLEGKYTLFPLDPLKNKLLHTSHQMCWRNTTVSFRHPFDECSKCKRLFVNDVTYFLTAFDQDPPHAL
jgi:hypothetical protein